MNGPKDRQQWKNALEKFEFGTAETAVVGDSLLTDINPGYQLGVRQLFLVDDGGDQWKVHVAGEPEGVVRISGIRDLVV